MSVEKVLVSVIAALFQSVAVTTICLKQQNINTKSEIIKFFIPMFLYCIFGDLFVPNQLRFVLFILAISLILFLILKIKDKIVLLYAFNTEIILALSEVIVTSILVLIGINSKDIVNDQPYNLIANIIISIFGLVISYIGFINRILNKITITFKKSKNLINYLYIVMIVLYLIVSKNGL